MKDSKLNSLRTAQAIARFGKAARHPLCMAWLTLQDMEAEYRNLMKIAFDACQLLDTARQEKKEAIALCRQFCTEGKDKEAREAAALIQASKELLQKLEAHYRAMGGIKRSVAICGQWKEFLNNAKFAFAMEQWWAKKTKDTKALSALRYLEKTLTKPMSDGQKRVLGILKMVGHNVVEGAWAVDGAARAYWVAAEKGERLLSDESLQGRFTVMEFGSGLEATYGPKGAGDKEGKEVRRTLRWLGIQPAKDQVGRKWKAPSRKKEAPKRPRGRPPTGSSIKPLCVENLANVEAALVKSPRMAKMDSWIKNPKVVAGIKGVETEKVVARIDYKWVKDARKEITGIEGDKELKAASRGKPW